MMQSLLLNGAASIKSNDSKVQEENDTRINGLKISKLADQQRNFARVMQDNLDKENAIAQSRKAARTQEVNKDNRFDAKDNRFEAKENRAQNVPVNNKVANESKSSEKNAGNDLDKKTTPVESIDDNENIDDSEKADKNTKLAKDEYSNESKNGDVGVNELVDSLIVESDSDEKPKVKAVNEQVEPVNIELKVNESDISLVDVGVHNDKAEEAKLVEDNIDIADFDLIKADVDKADIDKADTDKADIDKADIDQADIDKPVSENLDSELEPLGQSSLLSQIEAAQKADTKVKNKEGDESSDITMSIIKSQSKSVNIDDKKSQSLIGKIDVEPELESDPELQAELDSEVDVKGKLVSEVEAGLKTKTGAELDAKVDENVEKKPKLKLENNINLAKDTDNTESELDLESSLETLKPIEKAEHFSSLIKNETSVVNQSVVDVNGARPNQTSQVQLDKLIAFNQQAPAANNLLQEPLDIQSKHAAAMMGDRVMMMISQGKQEVEIRLDPAELGSMLIKVQVKQDQVQLHIQTQAGLSKDIIEQNMPRLREQLAQQGIQLSEANVQQQSQQQSQQQRQNQINSGSGQLANSQEVVNDQKNVLIPSKIPSLEQGIDYYV